MSYNAATTGKPVFSLNKIIYSTCIALAMPATATRYLLTCYRCIELNPVAANMVKHPGDYPWSSYRHNAFGYTNPIIKRSELYQRLGVTEEERRSRYRALFKTGLAKEDIHTIRSAVRFSMPVGDGRFKAQIERALGRSIGQAKRGH